MRNNNSGMSEFGKWCYTFEISVRLHLSGSNSNHNALDPHF